MGRRATRILKMRQLVLLLAAASSAANVKRLPPKASYCDSGSTTIWSTTPTTTRYPTTTSWYPTTPEETTTDEAWTTSGAACPLGWIDDGNLGCFLFAPQMAGLSWIEALEYCEEQDGFLAEPKTEDQLTFLTSLAYVEELATGVQGWWVGLADLGHEGEWVWQVDREDAFITAWDSGCPDLSEHNSRDCAALISITVKDEEKQLAARYRDLSCMLPVEEIQVAPICQRGGLNAGATTGSTTTVTTTERPECPYCWETYTGDGSSVKCFKYCGDTHYATGAEQNCLMQTFNPPNEVWIGAVDTDHNRAWEWTDGSSFDFNYWMSGQPDGGQYYTVMDCDDSTSGQWRDLEYSNSYQYMCQITL